MRSARKGLFNPLVVRRFAPSKQWIVLICSVWRPHAYRPTKTGLLGMNLAEKVSSGPIVSLVAAAGAAVTAVSGLVSSLGLQPFWADVATSAVFIILAIYWLLLAFKAKKRKAAPGFVNGAYRNKAALRIALIPYFCVVAVFIGISTWFAYPLFLHIFAPPWKICGTITTNCTSSYCVIGLDARSRPIFPECVAPLDISGYFELVPKDYTTYRPVSIRIQCAGRDLRVLRIPNEFMSPKCNGRIDLP